jgi:hypothetical protein
VSDDVAAVPRAARGLRRDWAALEHGPATHERFGSDSVAGLPEPARRWTTHAIAPGTPLWSSVLLTMRGQIRLGAWRRFTAREVLAPSRGFIWAATARVAGLPVTGYDRYSSGVGQMRWSLFGLPVMRASGVEVTRGTAGRLAGEAVLWLPTAYAAATWTDGPDPDTAVAAWRIGDLDDAVHLRVGSTGRLEEFWLDRWGNPDGDGFGRYPFGGRVEAEQAFDGVTIASRLHAGWWWGTDRQDDGEFFRATITDADFR